MNFINGKLEGDHFVMGDVKVLVPEGKLKMLREQNYVGKEVILGIRPEDIHDEPLFINFSPDTVIKASIEVAELIGAEIILYSKVNNQDFVARVDARFNVEAGESVELSFDLNKAHFFDCETELRIK